MNFEEIMHTSIADGVHLALVQDARSVLREAIDRDGAKGQVVFILDLDETLPFEMAAFYLAEFEPGARRVGSMLVLAASLGGAVYALRAPMHTGERGSFAELEQRALSQEQLSSGTHLCITLAAKGMQARAIQPAERTS